jgi:autotransporter-associated beta strand protein
MNRPTALAAGIAAAAATALPAAAQLPPGSWGLRFADEFHGQGGDALMRLDPVKWSPAYPWTRVHNYPAYIRDENIKVNTNDNGLLQLWGKRESFGGQPFTSGAINSNGKLNLRLPGRAGYMEARMKMPDFLGAWPAFWSLQDGWPPEIDTMEFVRNGPGSANTSPNNYVANVHFKNASNQNASSWSGFKNANVGDLTAGFHNFGVRWTDSSLTWYVDGNVFHSYTGSAAIAQMERMYLILNLGIGGWPGDPPAGENVNKSFDVDWVRVWQQTPAVTQSTWNKAASGNQNWDDPANWSGPAPDLSSQTAFFGTIATGATRLDWAGNKAVGAVTFQSATDYNVGWADDSLMLTNPGGRAYVNGYNQNGNGRMAISSRVELLSDTSVRNFLTTPITFNGLIIGTGELSAEHGKVILNGPGTFTGATRVKAGGDLTINGALSGTSHLYVNQGTATISTTGALTSSAWASVGEVAGDNGTLTLNGAAQLTAMTDLNVGDVSATGRMNVNGSAQVRVRNFYVGKYGAASGSVVQTGGSVTNLAAPGDWRIGGYGAADAAAVGAYTLAAGSINTSANFQIGAHGRGTMTHTGGALTATGVLSVGRFAGGVGTYDLSGTGVVTASAQPYLIVGEQGAGTLSVAGGTVHAATLALGHNGGSGTVTQTGGTVNATTGVAFGQLAAGGTGTYALSGGVLYAGRISRGPGGGTFNFNGGTLRAAGDSTVFLQGLTAAHVQAGGANVDTNGFAVTVAQPLTGPGGLTKSGAGTLTLAGPNTYAGPTAVQQGALLVNGALAAGSVTVAAGAKLGGSGSIGGVLDIGGELSPGNSPGTLRASSARFRSGATFSVEIAAAAVYDQVILNGPVTIDGGGTLAVQLPGGYVPAGGQSFDVMTFASAAGRFTEYTGVDLPGGLVLAPFYLDRVLRLIATVPGDLNGDGQVTFHDFQRLERTFGQPGTWQDGDFNFDGIINELDLKLLVAGYGQSIAVAAPLAPQSVPEPGGVALVATAVSPLLARRRRTRA